MEYKKVKNANQIITNSEYLIRNPEKYKNKWSSLFNNNNPIHLELGTGRGAFLINMAKLHPKINYIGVELNESQIATAAKHLQRENLSNIKLIHCDANRLFEIFGKEIDAIYLTFSEPWPKKIDEKKRFTHFNYLKIYDRIFKKNKHIILKTDNKGFFAYSLETLSQYWYTFNKVSLDLHHDENPVENVMTDFEKKYYEEGRPIYYVDARFDG